MADWNQACNIPKVSLYLTSFSAGVCSLRLSICNTWKPVIFKSVTKKKCSYSHGGNTFKSDFFIKSSFSKQVIEKLLQVNEYSWCHILEVLTLQIWKSDANF